MKYALTSFNNLKVIKEKKTLNCILPRMIADSNRADRKLIVFAFGYPKAGKIRVTKVQGYWTMSKLQAVAW